MSGVADTFLRVKLLIPTLQEAATRLGTFYSALVEEHNRGFSDRLPLEGYRAFPEWMQPRRYRTGGFRISSPMFRALGTVYGQVGPFRYPDTKAYSDDLHVFMRHFPVALAAVADATLTEMSGKLGELSRRFSSPGIEDQLHESATRIWREVDAPEILPGGVADAPQDAPEDDTIAKKAVDAYQSEAEESEALPGGVKDSDSAAAQPAPASRRQRSAYFVDRLRLLQALRRERDALLGSQEGRSSSLREAAELLAVLAVHPRTAYLIRAYADSPLKGTAAILEQVSAAVGAVSALKARLASEENADDAWGYAPFVVGAATRLRLGEIPGFPEFAVAAGQVLSRTDTTTLITAASLLVAALSIAFAGPAGAVVIGVVDLALAGTDLGMTLLRMHEQDIAATATDFSPEDQKLAEHSQGEDAALAVAGAFLAALALLGATRHLLKTRPRSPDKLKSVAPAKGPSKKSSASQTGSELDDEARGTGGQARGTGAVPRAEQLHFERMSKIEINGLRLSEAEAREAARTFAKVEQEVAEAAKGQAVVEAYYVPASVEDFVVAKDIGALGGKTFSGTGGAFPSFNGSRVTIVIGKEAAKGLVIRGVPHTLRTIIRHEIGEVLEIGAKARWPEFGDISRSHWRSSARGALLPGTTRAEQLRLLEDAIKLGMPEEVWETLAKELGILDPGAIFRRLTGDLSRGVRVLPKDDDNTKR